MYPSRTTNLSLPTSEEHLQTEHDAICSNILEEFENDKWVKQDDIEILQVTILVKAIKR